MKGDDWQGALDIEDMIMHQNERQFLEAERARFMADLEHIMEGEELEAEQPPQRSRRFLSRSLGRGEDR